MMCDVKFPIGRIENIHITRHRNVLMWHESKHYEYVNGDAEAIVENEFHTHSPRWHLCHHRHYVKLVMLMEKETLRVNGLYKMVICLMKCGLNTVSFLEVLGPCFKETANDRYSCLPLSLCHVDTTFINMFEGQLKSRSRPHTEPR